MNSIRGTPLHILLDSETRIASIDTALADQLGHPPTELIDRRFGTFVHADDVAALGASLVALVTGDSPIATTHTRLRDERGTAAPYDLSIEARRDNTRKLTGFAVTATPAADTSPAVLPDHLLRIHVPSALIDSTGAILDRNGAWTELFTPTGSAQSRIYDHIDQADQGDLREALGQLNRGAARTTRMQLRCAGPDGILWCRMSLSTLHGAPHLATATAEDISTEHLTNRVLFANESLFRSLAESSPVGLARLAPDMSITYATPSWRRLTGDPDSEHRDLPSALHPDGRARAVVDLQDRISRSSDEPVRARVADTDGPQWVHLRISPVHDDQLGHTGFVATVEDITDLVVANESQSQLAGVIESTSDLVGIADLRTGAILYLNAAAQHLFVDDAMSDDIHVSDLYPKDQVDRYKGEVYPVLRRGETWTGELTMLRHDGAEVRVLQTVAAEIGADGEPERASVLGRDVSNERQVLDELAYKATHDHLTGLPNRSLLIDHLELALARSARDHTPVAVLFIDLDRFKAVNDTYGHDVGDELLQEISARMSTVLRPSDTVARLGGDEFVVLCDDIEGELDALTIAGRVRGAIEDEPLVIRGVEMEISASVGIAMSNGGSTRDPETLLKRADTAMYRAKNSGRARTEIFDEVLRDRTLRRVEMGAQLRDAIEAQALELHYQPIVDLTSGRVAAVEAFIRWPHPQQGLLSPGDFLALAAETGLGQDLDEFVIHRACVDARRWNLDLGETSPPVQVNVSGPSLLAGALSQRLDQCLRATGLPPHKLCLELSETFLMSNGDTKTDRLQQIQALGVRLCIDDVGAGATVLTRLSRYNLDMLKIDGTLTKNVVESDQTRQVVAGLAALGQALGLQVAAENVESEAAIGVLRELGAAMAQGHVFSHPLPASKIEPLLTLRSTLARVD